MVIRQPPGQAQVDHAGMEEQRGLQLQHVPHAPPPSRQQQQHHHCYHHHHHVSLVQEGHGQTSPLQQQQLDQMATGYFDRGQHSNDQRKKDFGEFLFDELVRMEPGKEPPIRQAFLSFRAMPSPKPAQLIKERVLAIVGEETAREAGAEAEQKYRALQQQQEQQQQASSAHMQHPPPPGQQHQVSTPLEQHHQHHKHQVTPAQHGHVQPTPPPPQQVDQSQARPFRVTFPQILYEVLGKMEPTKEAQRLVVLAGFRASRAHNAEQILLEQLEGLYGKGPLASACKKAEQQYRALQQQHEASSAHIQHPPPPVQQQQQPLSQQHRMSTLEHHQHSKHQVTPAQHGHVQAAPPPLQVHQTRACHSMEAFLQILCQVLVTMEPAKEAQLREVLHRLGALPADDQPKRMMDELQYLYGTEPITSAWREAAQQWRAVQQQQQAVEVLAAISENGLDGNKAVLWTVPLTCAPQQQVPRMAQPGQASVPPCEPTAQEQRQDISLQEVLQLTGWPVQKLQLALLNLNHARQCRRVDDRCPEDYRNCSSGHEALDHILHCGKLCQFPDCGEMKWLIWHQWRCIDRSCTLCAPVRKTSGAPRSTSMSVVTRVEMAMLACVTLRQQAQVPGEPSEALQEIRQDAQQPLPVPQPQQQQVLAQEDTPDHAETASDSVAQGWRRVAPVLRARLQQRKQQRQQQQQPHTEQEEEEQRKRAMEEVANDLSKLNIDEQVAAIEGDTRVSEAAARKRTDKNRRKKERQRQQKQKRQEDDGCDANADQSDEQSSERQVESASSTIPISSSSNEETPHSPHISASGGGKARGVQELAVADVGAQVADGEVLIRGEEGRGEEGDKEVGEGSEDMWLCEGAPDDLLCPVSMVLLTDPVVAPDGRTYQREALQQCIDYAAEKKVPLRSPVTGLPMAPLFFPNVMIRSQALEYIQRKMAQRTT